MFTASHRGGDGPPLVLLHGFLETWRSWELVLPALERRHDVLALTLAGHAGGPALPDGPPAQAVADAVERAMDEAGFATAHVAGNSLGGYVALQLAERDRARTVVALAPAGGWAPGDPAPHALLEQQTELLAATRAAAPYAEQLVATPQGRRRASALLTERSEHLPAELLAHLICGIAACPGADRLIAAAHEGGWPLDPARVRCPLRFVWGTADRLLPWPAAARRYREDWFWHADWVELDGVGHAPQLDVPLEAAQLILGFTSS